MVSNHLIQSHHRGGKNHGCPNAGAYTMWKVGTMITRAGAITIKIIGSFLKQRVLQSYIL